MTRNTTCSECGGEMKEGFIPDLNYRAIFKLAWVEGKPKSSFWTIIANDFAGRKNYFITAYRCERCGFVKLYTESDLSAFK